LTALALCHSINHTEYCTPESHSHTCTVSPTGIFSTECHTIFAQHCFLLDPNVQPSIRFLEETTFRYSRSESTLQ